MQIGGHAAILVASAAPGAAARLDVAALRLYVHLFRHLFASSMMKPAHPPTHPGGSLTEALEQRHREGRPVRVGLIGAGQMGTDILAQVAQMRGIEVVAAADTVPDIVLAACAIAGDG